MSSNVARTMDLSRRRRKPPWGWGARGAYAKSVYLALPCLARARSHMANLFGCISVLGIHPPPASTTRAWAEARRSAPAIPSLTRMAHDHARWVETGFRAACNAWSDALGAGYVHVSSLAETAVIFESRCSIESGKGGSVTPKSTWLKAGGHNATATS